MKRLVGQRVRRPAGAELREPAVAAPETAEVDAAEMAECFARLRGKVCVVGGATGLVELDPTRFTVHVHKSRQEAGAANGDLATGKVACDRRQLILFADTLLMPSEAERRESADDDEENRNAAHTQRIGRPSDGIDSDLVAQSH
jgi:hypothetical protein